MNKWRDITLCSIRQKSDCLHKHLSLSTTLQYLATSKYVCLISSIYYVQYVYLMSSICNTYEDMAARASETPETTAQLVELINYIMDCRDAAMFDLREKARTTAEYVLFLMQHAHLTCEYLSR